MSFFTSKSLDTNISIQRRYSFKLSQSCRRHSYSIQIARNLRSPQRAPLSSPGGANHFVINLQIKSVLCACSVSDGARET